jgi:hypothetical protein
VWGDTGRVALVPVNTATCKTTHTHTSANSPHRDSTRCTCCSVMHIHGQVHRCHPSGYPTGRHVTIAISPQQRCTVLGPSGWVRALSALATRSGSTRQERHACPCQLHLSVNSGYHSDTGPPHRQACEHLRFTTTDRTAAAACAPVALCLPCGSCSTQLVGRYQLTPHNSGATDVCSHSSITARGSAQRWQVVVYCTPGSQVTSASSPRR